MSCFYKGIRKRKGESKNMLEKNTQASIMLGTSDGKMGTPTSEWHNHTCSRKVSWVCLGGFASVRDYKEVGTIPGGRGRRYKSKEVGTIPKMSYWSTHNFAFWRNNTRQAICGTNKISYVSPLVTSSTKFHHQLNPLANKNPIGWALSQSWSFSLKTRRFRIRVFVHLVIQFLFLS